MIGMIIAVITSAAMCTYFAARSIGYRAEAKFLQEIIDAWYRAIDLDHVKEEWSKYKELSESEKTAVLEFGLYILDSVRTEVWGNDETEEST